MSAPLSTLTDEDPGRPVAPVLQVARTLALARSGVEARMIEAARVAVAACGDELLAGKGFASVDELTPAQRRSWRAEAKATAVMDLQASLGIGQEEARQLVALGCAPTPVRALVVGALDAGLVSWWQARTFWRRCARLTPDQSALVAQALFTVEPGEADVAAVERLDPDGNLTVVPWPQQPYQAALEREAVAVEGVDAAAERARRRLAREQARRVALTVHDDGTATLSITGEVIDLCAAHTRIERAARLLRKHGEGRTLDQLREAVARILLIHGTIPLPEGHHPDDPDDLSDLTEQELDDFAQVINGHARLAMQIVIPWDALTNTPACVHCGHGRSVDGTAEATTSHPDDQDGAGGATASDHPDDHDGPGHQVDSARRDREDSFDPGVDSARRGREDSPGPGVDSVHRGTVGSPGPGVDCAEHPTPSTPCRQDTARDTGRGTVGQVLGVTGAAGVFIAPGHARELALRPGTTFFRLLTDPADGRLIERTIRAYHPDTDMRRQIIAADVTARLPWTTHPAGLAELDHVARWTADEDGNPTGGQTCELNLASVSKKPHEMKTRKLHASAINDRRDLTWTTLLAARYRTRVHDYRQYLAQVRTRCTEDEYPDHEVARVFRKVLARTYERAAHQTAVANLLDEVGAVGHDGQTGHDGRSDHDEPDLPWWVNTHGTPSMSGTPCPGQRSFPHLDLTADEARDHLRDLVCQALYAALATRGPGAFLEDVDDLPGATLHGGETAGWFSITHTRDHARRPGPAPGQPTPERLLHMDDIGGDPDGTETPDPPPPTTTTTPIDPGQTPPF